MIVLHPSLGVKKYFDYVDFGTLSAAITSACAMVHNKHFNRVIRVFKSRNHDYYERGSDAIFLKFEERTDEQVIQTIIHEVRHWQQDNIYKMTFKLDEYDDSTYDTYRNSPIEVDARNFEGIISKDVIKVYRHLQKIKEKSDKHGLKKFYRPTRP